MSARLRVLADVRAQALPIARLRARLGGAIEVACERAGDVVVVADDGAAGVVLDADATHAHVWLGEGRVRRVGLERLSPSDLALEPSFAEISRRARELSELREGERVRFRDHGRPEIGTVAERCRFGAIVARADGSMVGVGFTRLARERRDA